MEPELDDRLDWLRAKPRVPKSIADTGEPDHPTPKTPLNEPRLGQLVAGTGCEVPDALVILARERSIQQRIRSCTLCYFDLGDRLVSVAGGGHLIHFLSDQQWVMHWLVYSGPGPHGCVIATTEPLGFDDDDGPHFELRATTDAIVCAASLSEFIYRFWIENEIFFAHDEGRPFTEEQTRYLAGVRGTAA